MMGASPRQRVLVVEDNVDLRDTLVILLELVGHTVLSAPDGSTAVALAKSETIEVALIDIGLPDMDGYEVARRLREDPSTCGIRLVALTGYAASEHEERARATGFDRHLAKPVDIEDLERALLRPEGHRL